MHRVRGADGDGSTDKPSPVGERSLVTSCWLSGVLGVSLGRCCLQKRYQSARALTLSGEMTPVVPEKGSDSLLRAHQGLQTTL